MSDYRPEFAAALEIFAIVSEHMDAQGIRPPILVGVRPPNSIQAAPSPQAISM